MRESVLKVCKIHGNHPHRNYAGDGRWRCLGCEADRKKNHRARLKLRLVEEFGGKCRVCGYNKYIGALEFHHLDPSQKSFNLGSTGWMKGYEVTRKEAEKCILLCSNCHKEVEAGITDAGSANGRLRDSESRHVGSNPALAAI